MSPAERLSLVRHQLDVFAGVRLQSPLDAEARQAYWALCQSDQELLTGDLVHRETEAPKG